MILEYIPRLSASSKLSTEITHFAGKWQPLNLLKLKNMYFWLQLLFKINVNKIILKLLN